MKQIVFAVYLLSIVCLPHASLTGQDIVWQKLIGGSGHDFIEDAIYTKDHGMLITCSSDSDVSGDKTEKCFGGYDYWIIKTNQEGEILWQRTLGGDQDDEPIAVVETRDGGYLICGESSSGINGNKTSGGFGKQDFWLVKLDSKGKTVWQQSYGKSWVDHLVTAFPDPTGGYVLAGYTWVDTDDTAHDSNKKRYDCWLLVINEKGKVIWEETIGGIHDDMLTDAMTDHKGNILVSGYTTIKTPGGQGQKSTEHKESGLFCISPEKNMRWQKPILSYGTYSCEKMAVDHDNRYYIGGVVFPGVSKENVSDLLILVLNENGDIVRDFALGGSGADFINHMAISPENELYVGGTSNSGISKDKSEPSFGMMDGWVSKYDALGNKMWDKTIGGASVESLAKILPLGNNLTVFMQTTSTRSGNLTEESKGESDILIVHLKE